MENYFNHDIVRNHENIMSLNNSMSEFYNFCLSLSINTETDNVWYYEHKQFTLCYDL